VLRAFDVDFPSAGNRQSSIRMHPQRTPASSQPSSAWPWR
jgi:hypothetical protein